MRRITSALIMVAFMAAFCTTALTGQQGILPQQQEQQAVEVREESDTVEIVPVPVTEIPTASNQTFTLISEWNKQKLTEQEKEAFSSQVDSVISQTAVFLSDTALNYIDESTIRELENLQGRLKMYSDLVNALESRLINRSEQVEGAFRNLSLQKERWIITRESSTGNEIPSSIRERIDRVIHGIDSVNALIQADLEFLLDQQGRVSDRYIQLTMLNEQITESIQEHGGNLLVRDMPGFIPALKELKDTELIRNHLQQIKDAIKSDTRIFMSEFRGTLIFAVIFFLVMLALSSYYRINYRNLIFAEKVEESEFHMILIRAPLLTTLFLTSLVTRLIYHELPHTYQAISLMLLMFPTVVFVLRMFHQHVKTWIGLLVVIYLLSFIYEFMFYPDILLRILLMAFSVTGIIFFVWVLRSRPTGSAIKNPFVARVLRTLITGFIVMLSISIIANLVGAFRLAEFFTLAPIEIFLVALAIFVTTKVAGALVFLVLISQWLHKLNWIREDFQIIYRKTERLLRIILWMLFAVSALRILLIKDAIFTWGERVFTTGWKIGEVNITPASILVFVFVIWIAVVITRMITRILEKDVFVRVSMAKGVPSTVIMLLRIALITGGFFFAAAAAGMELTNLSIVLGAFSVGIGFGLQNIFNNMVSGLILAFERPIKVGDTVQVGQLTGTVLSIGLRSSVVRSFDGAEVIVPNGNLISDQMINWTRSDSNRRMDIRVGVAYGTDPEKVLAILFDVANNHAMVDKTIEPRAYFIGFGESSLDFRLLAWTDIEHRLPTESEIHVTINARLKEAGIEIPFPQRDLHIRSDATRPSSPRKAQPKKEKEDSIQEGGNDQPASGGKESPASGGKEPPAKSDKKDSGKNLRRPHAGDGMG